jgi:hypothetical protein
VVGQDAILPYILILLLPVLWPLWATPVKSNDNITEGQSFGQMIMSLKGNRSVK